jgi:putative chitinase
MITDTQIQQVMPHATRSTLHEILEHLNRAMQAHGVDTMLRTAAFIAQLAHESAEFRFMEEIWGPIEAQLRYEPPGELARRLGNTEAGDGKRFKGRGPIQITGRFNYRKYGELLGIDLVDHPELAAQPAVGFDTAGLFWESNGLNKLADSEQFVAITRRINGGTHGLADREAYYLRARSVLADNFIAGDFPVPRTVTRGGRPARRAIGPLSRGHEAIVDSAPPGKPARRRRSEPAQF